MKFLHIIGSVIAFHAALFLLAGVLPGCRSTTRKSPSPSDTAVDSTPGPQVRYPAASSSDLSGGLVTAAPENFATSSAELPSLRFNPTRPSNPAAQSLAKPAEADVQPAMTYTVVLRDSLWSIAKKHKVSQAELAAANNLAIDATIRVGQKLIIPQKAAPAVTEMPRQIEGDTLTYTVRAGDNLGQIAKRSGVTVAAIRKLNNLPNDQVRPGQKLILPAGEATASALGSALPAATPTEAKTSVTHTVRSGETLDQIARRYGVKARDIATLNRISNPNKLSPGKTLSIPGVSAAVANQAAEKPATGSPAPIYTPAGPVTPAPADTPVEQPLITPANDLITPAAPPVVPVENGLITPGK